MAAQKFSQVTEEDATILKFIQDEGDIGNWAAVLDGIYLENTAFDDNIPEGTEVPVILDDRDGPVERYDSYGEASYNVGITIPSHSEAIEQVLAEAAGVYENQATGNASNIVGDPTTAPTTNSSGEEFYALKVTGSSPYSFSIDRCGIAHLDPDNFLMCYFRSGLFVDIASDSAASINVTNRQKGTIEVSGLTLLGSPSATGSLRTYDRATAITCELAGGDIVTIDYIDENLQPGDTYMIASLAYQFAQMPNVGDFQISRQIARARRQQLTLYRPMGNSTNSKRWVKRIYPEVRLVGPPAESTGTGQNSLNQRVFNFRVERIQHNDFQGDFYLEQYLDFG